MRRQTPAPAGPAGSTDGASEATSSVLDLRSVTVSRHHEGRRVLPLRDATWRVRAGEHWAVLGPNGAGKSTLLVLAGAVIQPSSGTAHVLGERLGRTDVRTLRERIGLVDAGLTRALRDTTPGQRIVLSGAHGGVRAQRRRLGPADEARAQELMEAFDAADLGARPFGDCSQGERQRLLLARALMPRPALLLLDEPAVGLDLPSRERLVGALRALAERTDAPTTVTVTHHLEELPPTTTHALLLRDGAVLAAGPVAEVLTSERLSACFGLALVVDRRDGRHAARILR